MSSVARRRRMLLVGGGGGFVGRAVLAEFGPTWSIRSLHRAPSRDEIAPDLEWVRGDAALVSDWRPLLRDVDLVLVLAWYRFGSERRFAPLADGLLRLVAAAEAAGTSRFLHLSVPDAPESLETGLPYLAHKRRVDRAIEQSRLSYSIVRPTMLFGPRDKLLTVMLRTMHRYHRFVMFGDGGYHVSPISVRDLARILAREAALDVRHNVTAGGPTRWVYRELTDAMFARLGRPPRYVHLSPRGGVRLARFLEAVRSTLLYAYEVEWLVSGRLGLAPYEGLSTPLAPVEPFLDAEAARLRGGRPAGRG